MSVTFYYDLQTPTFNQIKAKFLTRIHGKPTWNQVKTLIQEYEEITLNCVTSYTWSGDYGLLTDIQGAARLTMSNLAYVAPVQPLNHHMGKRSMAIAYQTGVLTAENNLLKHNWAIVKGFCWALSANIRDSLDSRYHNQLKHCVLHYRNVQQRQYITYLKSLWVVLDEWITDKLTKHFYPGWNKQ